MIEITRWASFISGGGSTMEAMIKAVNAGHVPRTVPTCIISSSVNAGGIQKARELGVSEKDIIVLRPQDFETEEEYEERLLFELETRHVNLISLNGYLKKVPTKVIRKYATRSWNQHPADPKFGGKGMYGMNVHEAVLYFAQHVGRPFRTQATAQRIFTDYDQGPVLDRILVEVKLDDTAETLQRRVLPAEHQLNIEVLRAFASGNIPTPRGRPEFFLDSDDELIRKAIEHALKEHQLQH